jgi:hypothetical protein
MLKARRLLASLFATMLVAVGALAPSAGAQVQNGLVNVAIGDVNILNNADIGVAAQVAANLCGLKVGPVAVLGTAVDRSGDARTVCTTNQGPIRITQA